MKKPNFYVENINNFCATNETTAAFIYMLTASLVYGSGRDLSTFLNNTDNQNTLRKLGFTIFTDNKQIVEYLKVIDGWDPNLLYEEIQDKVVRWHEGVEDKIKLLILNDYALLGIAVIDFEGDIFTQSFTYSGCVPNLANVTVQGTCNDIETYDKYYDIQVVN